MNEHFGSKRWEELTALELRRNGDADSLFTVPAYCYFLPAYLVASIQDPKQLDICVDHLEYRFGPKPEDSSSIERLQLITHELSASERAVVLSYFRFVLQRDGNFDGYCQRAINNLLRHQHAA